MRTDKYPGTGITPPLVPCRGIKTLTNNIRENMIVFMIA